MGSGYLLIRNDGIFLLLCGSEFSVVFTFVVPVFRLVFHHLPAMTSSKLDAVYSLGVSVLDFSATASLL